jgi:hypothetical protein
MVVLATHQHLPQALGWHHLHASSDVGGYVRIIGRMETSVTSAVGGNDSD